MSIATEQLEPEEGQNPLPGLPGAPQFEGKPVVRCRANISGVGNVQAPGPLQHGDRGYVRLYFAVEDVHYPPAEKERDAQGSLLGRRLSRLHILKGLEAEFLTVEDEHGRPVTFNEGQREVG